MVHRDSAASCAVYGHQYDIVFVMMITMVSMRRGGWEDIVGSETSIDEEE